jgi:hypothetical protein
MRRLLTTERFGARTELARFGDREVEKHSGRDDTMEEPGVDRILWSVQPCPTESP